VCILYYSNTFCIVRCITPPLLQVTKSFKVAVAQSSPTLVPGRGAPRTASSSSSEVRWLRAGMEAPQVVVEPHRATPLAHAYE
jgi:hypothetical protein